MAVEAAVRGDVLLLKQAMLHDPLTAAVCNPEEIWQMTDEMLTAQARWLPQYQERIPAAQARLDAAVRDKDARAAARRVGRRARAADEERARDGGGQSRGLDQRRGRRQRPK